MSNRIGSVVALFCLLWAAGCGNDQENFVFTSSGSSGTSVANQGVTARFVFDIGQPVLGRIPDSALTFRLQIFDPESTLIREVEEPRTQEIVVTDLPQEQLRVRILFLDADGQTVGYIDRFLDPQSPDESTTLIIDVLFTGTPPPLPPFPDPSTAGVLTSLAFAEFPASIQVGTEFLVEVVALDGFNELVATETGPVSVTAASGGTVSGGDVVNFVNGVAAFPALAATGQGPLVLSANSGAISALSLPIAVTQQPNISLQAPRAYPLRGYRLTPLLADLNGDGAPDLVSFGTNLSDPTFATQALQTSLNQGDGTFGQLNFFELPNAGGRQISASDLDRDGDIDIGVGTSGSVQILLNNGDGTFAAPTQGLNSSPAGLTFDDLDGDQIPDLIATQSGQEIAVALGNGDGTFGTAETFDSTNDGLALYTGDFDNDEQRDVLMLSFSTNDVFVLFGNGDGTLEAPVAVSLPGNPVGVSVGDLDGDQVDDLVAAVGQTAVFVPSNGDGSFGASETVTFPSTVEQLSVVDFDGDEILDLLVAMDAQTSLGLAPGNGDGTFGPVSSFFGERNGLALASGDLNGDERLDVVQSAAFGTSVFIQDVQGDLTGTSETLVAGRRATEVVSGDFNEDGHLDIAVTNDLDRMVSIFLGDGDGGFSPETTFGTIAVSLAIATGDFDDDNHLDLAFGTNLASEIGVIYGNGDGTFGNGITLTPPRGPNDLNVADMNGDSRPDLVSTNTFDSSISVFLSGSGRSFSSPQTESVAGAVTHSQIGDLNGDGDQDVVTINDGNLSYSVSLGDGDGEFLSTVETDLGERALSVGLGDLDGDGELDLALAVRDGLGNIALRTLLGNGDGTFRDGSTQSSILTGFGLALGDVNGDSVLDVVTGGSYLTTFVGNGDGSLQPPVSFSAGDQPRGISLGDFNEDGKLDVVVTNILEELVQVLLSL